MNQVYLFTRKLLVMLIGIGVSFQVASQNITVTGKITSADDGSGVPGANILEKGTTNGAITDVDGNFSINVPGDATLVVSFIGFIAREVPVNGRSYIDVVLQTDIQELAEVVVIGYGQVEAKDATGAINSIKEKDFNRGVISSPEQLIQGRTAGVQITNSSGEPGGGVNIRIRGTSSVRSGNNPLFVVDGVPLSGDDTSASGSNASFGNSSARNPLNFINPNDIASIDILKDASATAIYGSRGANGVVIITTKSGKAGQGKLDYAYNLGVATISEKYDLLDANEFLDAYAGFNGQQAADDINGGAATDWQDEIFRTGITHSHNVSYGGGDEKGDFRFSLSYFDQEGIVERSGLQRVSGRFNGTRKFVNDRLKISTQFTVADTDDENVPITDNSGFRGDLLGAALKMNPTLPVRNPDGTFVQPSLTETNPIAMLEFSKSFTSTLRALGNVSAEFEIIKGLSFKTVVGFDRSFSSRKDAYSRDLKAEGIEDQGRLFVGDIEINNQLWENYFTYNTTLGNDIELDALAGYSYQSFEFEASNFEFTNFRTSDLNLMINNFASAAVEDSNGELQQTVVGTNSESREDELQSFFGRVNLSVQDKYLFTATLRADGSTRFGSGNRYGYFPSFAFKWRLGEENFLPAAFSDLSLRLGYGITGNQEIPHNLFQERQRYADWDINENGDIEGGGLETVAFPNPDLKWESTSQINIGVDFAFLDSRLSGSLDLYRKNTNDLLIQLNSAQPAVQQFFWTNLDADVINRGIELSLNGVIKDQGKLRWDVLANIAYNDNEVQNFDKLINTGDIDGQGLTGAFSQRIAEGQPLFAYFLRDFAGYDESGISIYSQGDIQNFTGDSPLPTVNAGLTNNFSYGNFDLSVFFSGQFGHSVYSNTANAFFTAGSLANGRNVTRDVVGNGESPLNTPDVSTRFLEKGDFIRLQNVSLGYNVPLQSEFISSLRFFIAGQNLFVITDYSGQDPEVNVNKAIDDVPSFGIDYTTYPRARTFTFGANMSF
ncbi:MAG: TonB-dependent receptor [Cytophagales bacterium]|nr:TonB-dependent receptor [Cytophagales bacterium]